MSEAIDEKKTRYQALVAKMAIRSMGKRNATGWSTIAVALALEPGIAPKMQRHLQARAWSVRQQIRKRAAANPGLTQDQIHEAALEIAGEILNA